MTDKPSAGDKPVVTIKIPDAVKRDPAPAPETPGPPPHDEALPSSGAAALKSEDRAVSTKPETPNAPEPPAKREAPAPREAPTVRTAPAGRQAPMPFPADLDERQGTRRIQELYDITRGADRPARPLNEAEQSELFIYQLQMIRKHFAAGDCCYGIIGGSESGKTTFMARTRLRHQGLASMPLTTLEQVTIGSHDGAQALKTPRGFFHLFDFGDHFFIDVAGEDFAHLLDPAGDQHIKAQVSFYREWATRCRGFIFLINLMELLREGRRYSEMLLDAVAFVRVAVQQETPDAGAITRDELLLVAKRLPKLAAPVVVLFSKADCMLGRREFVDRDGNYHDLDPDVQNPVAYARRHAPDVYLLMQNHVRNFKFDFAQSFLQRGEERQLIDLGAMAAIEFLTRFRPSRWRFSTKTLLGIDRVLRPGAWR